MTLFTSSPGKYVWGTGAILFNLLKLPLLAIYHLPTFTRPDNEWTVFQSVMNHLMNSFLYHTAYVKAVTPLDLKPGSLGDRFATIPKGPDAIYVGIAEGDHSIVPSLTGGIWYAECPRQAPSEGEKPIILHFHPGGYAIGDVRTDASFAARLLTERVAPHTLFSLYRLGSNRKGRFPAALQDGLSAYYYLLNDLSIPASQIILSGDSAGGHVVICLLRYLAEHGKATGLPTPRGALLWSPAIDMIAATRPETISSNRNYAKDYLDPSFVVWGAKGFASPDPAASSYMNPLGAPFSSPCPIWAFCGGNEVFCDEISSFVQELKSIPGNVITYRQERLANHDIFFSGNLTGWKAEAERAADEAGKWVSQLGAN